MNLALSVLSPPCYMAVQRGEPSGGAGIDPKGLLHELYVSCRFDICRQICVSITGPCSALLEASAAAAAAAVVSAGPLL
jgi:hypothetical protein